VSLEESLSVSNSSIWSSNSFSCSVTPFSSLSTLHWDFQKSFSVLRLFQVNSNLCNFHFSVKISSSFLLTADELPVEWGLLSFVICFLRVSTFSLSSLTSSWAMLESRLSRDSWEMKERFCLLLFRLPVPIFELLFWIWSRSLNILLSRSFARSAACF